MQPLRAEVEVLHPGAPLPLVEGDGGARNRLPRDRGEELQGEGVLVGPGEALRVTLLSHELLVVPVELPNLFEG